MRRFASAVFSALAVTSCTFAIAGAVCAAQAPPRATGQSAPAAGGASEFTSTAETRARGQALVKQAVAAMGGADKLAGVKDITVKGKVVLSGPMGEVSGDSVAYVLYPDKIKSTVTLPMGPMVQGFDGNRAWVQMGGQTQELPAAMNEEMQRGIVTSGGIELMRLALEGQAEVDATGEGDVNGKRADVLLWRRGSQQMQVFLDAGTHLLARLAFRGTTPQGPIDAEVTASDHRDVSGVKIPFKVVGTQGGQPYLQLTVTSVQINAGLDPAMFAKP